LTADLSLNYLYKNDCLATFLFEPHTLIVGKLSSCQLIYFSIYSESAHPIAGIGLCSFFATYND